MASESNPAEARSRLFRRFGKNFTVRATIYDQGDDAQECFLLQDGRVQLGVKSGERTYSLRVLKAGEIFGDEAWFESATRRSTAIALSEVSVLAIDRATLFELITTHSEVAMTIVTQLVERLRYAEEQIDSVLTKDVPLRVVRGLLSLLREAEKAANGFALTLTPVELSSRLVLDVDEVKQVMGQLREKGYLNLDGERIVIAKAEPLRDLAHLLESNDNLRNQTL